MADVAMYLFEMADNMGIDLLDAMNKKLVKNKLDQDKINPNKTWITLLILALVAFVIRLIYFTAIKDIYWFEI